MKNIKHLIFLFLVLVCSLNVGSIHAMDAVANPVIASLSVAAKSACTDCKQLFDTGAMGIINDYLYCSSCYYAHCCSFCSNVIFPESSFYTVGDKLCCAKYKIARDEAARRWEAYAQAQAAAAAAAAAEQQRVAMGSCAGCQIFAQVLWQGTGYFCTHCIEKSYETTCHACGCAVSTKTASAYPGYEGTTEYFCDRCHNPKK